MKRSLRSFWRWKSLSAVITSAADNSIRRSSTAIFASSARVPGRILNPESFEALSWPQIIPFRNSLFEPQVPSAILHWIKARKTTRGVSAAKRLIRLPRVVCGGMRAEELRGGYYAPKAAQFVRHLCSRLIEGVWSCRGPDLIDTEGEHEQDCDGDPVPDGNAHEGPVEQARSMAWMRMTMANRLWASWT